MAHIFSPLRGRPMALLWSGLSLSAIGDQLYSVALTWIAVGVLGANAGYLTALQAGVVLLAVLGIGRWADRWDSRSSMIGADLCRAGVLLAIVLPWMATGVVSRWRLVGAVAVLAIGQSVFQPALQTILPRLIEDKRLLPAANGLLDATDRSARLLGPGLIGLLGGMIPVMHFLTLDAASFLASAAAVALIGKCRPASGPFPRAREPVLANIGRGVRAMRGHKLLGFMLQVSGLLNGAWYAAFYLALPLLITQHGVTGPGGSGIAAFGLVISAYGCANLAATLVIGSRTMPAQPQAQMFGGNLLLGFAILLLAFATRLPAAWILPGLMASAALGAAGGPMKDIPMAVLRQTRLHHADMGAATRAYMAVTNAGTLGAMLLVPSLIGAIGALAVLIVCGALYLVVGLSGLRLFAGWTETEAELPAPQR
ncbi:MFS transporter [Methylocapsa sp. S129]|uniref:MFS transporter n=1 Tax=Methylocapsa sp. S129 TaxID=1641869 RepID=UPI00131B60BF|nr:MFS transporter [Methylocapsa sp. S129]